MAAEHIHRIYLAYEHRDQDGPHRLEASLVKWLDCYQGLEKGLELIYKRPHYGSTPSEHILDDIRAAFRRLSAAYNLVRSLAPRSSRLALHLEVMNLDMEMRYSVNWPELRGERLCVRP